MDNIEPTQHEIDSFRRFMILMPGIDDLDLIILKGHLLIEEQLRTIVKKRIRGYIALDLDNHSWSFFHVVHLAEALCHNEDDEIIWECIRKLNKIRNDIAHILEPKGLSDRADDLNSSWPSGFEEGNQKELLNLTLWSMFTFLSGLARNSEIQ